MESTITESTQTFVNSQFRGLRNKENFNNGGGRGQVPREGMRQNKRPKLSHDNLNGTTANPISNNNNMLRGSGNLNQVNNNNNPEKQPSTSTSSQNNMGVISPTISSTVTNGSTVNNNNNFPNPSRVGIQKNNNNGFNNRNPPFSGRKKQIGVVRGPPPGVATTASNLGPPTNAPPEVKRPTNQPSTQTKPEEENPIQLPVIKTRHRNTEDHHHHHTSSSSTNFDSFWPDWLDPNHELLSQNTSSEKLDRALARQRKERLAEMEKTKLIVGPVDVTNIPLRVALYCGDGWKRNSANEKLLSVHWSFLSNEETKPTDPRHNHC